MSGKKVYVKKGGTTMSEAMENMLNRRSVRKYKSESVPKDVIEKILEAGSFAANGMGKQSPIMIAITDKSVRDELAEDNRKIGGWNEGFDPFYGAPVVIVVLADKSMPTRIYDGSCAMENLMLAAHAEGLGSCWIHRAKEEFEMPKWQKWMSDLGIEGEFEGIGHCILGYPDGDEPKAAPRKENRIFWA
jgi:nitroreductase